MRLLVSGDRRWDDRRLLFDTLDGLEGVTELVEGCARGADRLAEEWAASRGVWVRHCPAQWDKFGRAAGPLRNREMLAMGPDQVVAFHDDLGRSKGTADMVAAARKAGVPVRIVGHVMQEATSCT